MYLDERKKRILAAIISAYIETGEPVGSKALLDRENLSVSSATVRNEMSELEQLGYLVKTHTSSGRIPSNLGYRFYVTNALNPYRLLPRDRAALDGLFEESVGLEDMVRTAAERLAVFSGCTVFAVSPNSTDGMFTFEVVPAGKKIFALMAISSSGTVKNYFLRSDHEATSEDAEKLTQICNRVLSGFSVDIIGAVRFALLEHEIRTYCPQHAGISKAAKQVLSRLRTYELHIGGSANLLHYPEFSDIDTARRFVHFLSQHEHILEAILSFQPEEKIDIRIGMENTLFQNPAASLITVTCRDKIPIRLSLMGPTRMNYAKTIAGCNYFICRLQKYLTEEY